MLKTTRAIVLRSIAFKDKQVIVYCYTENLGLQTFIYKLSGKSKKGIISSLNQIEVCFYQKQNNTLAYIRETKLLKAYYNTRNNMYKSAQLIFLNEVLNKCLKEEQPDKNLFSYLCQRLDLLDEGEYNPWFHHRFLIGLMAYLGIQPSQENRNNYLYFDLQNGVFSQTKPKLFLEKEYLQTFMALLKNEEIYKFNAYRKKMLEYIIQYYTLHIPGFEGIKSVDVLSEIIQ